MTLQRSCICLCIVEIITGFSRPQQGIYWQFQLYQHLDTVNSARPRHCQSPETPTIAHIPPGRMPRRYGVHCADAASPGGAKPLAQATESTTSKWLRHGQSSTATMIHISPSTGFLRLRNGSEWVLFPPGQGALVDKPLLWTVRCGLTPG